METASESKPGTPHLNVHVKESKHMSTSHVLTITFTFVRWYQRSGTDNVSYYPSYAYVSGGREEKGRLAGRSLPNLLCLDV